MNWYLKVLQHFADFTGRARRKEFWMFILFNFIFSLVAMGLDNVLGTKMAMPGDYSHAFAGGYINMLYSLVVLIPTIAVTVRRLHDIGKSGVYFFIAFIPLIGGIWLLVLMIKEGQRGDNQYGSDPKTIDESEGGV
ncbi:MAG: DUF805 domain-containing protein [Paludibacteraceae bacterium]